MVFKFMWIMLLTNFDAVFAVITKDIKNVNQTHGHDWIAISDPKSKLIHQNQNTSMLVTYANNTFGPSVKVKTLTPGMNATEILYLKGHALKTPNLSKIKFNLASPLNYSIYSGERSKLVQSFQEQRTKRGVLHLYNMVSCATGCNPLIYKGYGCYCGFLGSGYAVDGIDRCCKAHDWCYDKAKCPMFFEYIVPYFWKCYYNRPICAIYHGEFGGPGSCASRLCECDRVLSECLSQYPCPSTRALCRSSPLRLFQNALMFYP